MSTVHIVPVDDLIEHDTSTAEPDCVCGPRVHPVEANDHGMNWAVHSSLDGREARGTA